MFAAFFAVVLMSALFAVITACSGKEAEIEAEDIHIASSVTSVDISEYATATIDGESAEVTADFSGVTFGQPGEYTVKITAGDTTVERKVYVYGMPVITGNAIVEISWKEAADVNVLSEGITAEDTFGTALELVLEESVPVGEYGRYAAEEHIIKFKATDRVGQTATFSRTVEVTTDILSLDTVMCYTDQTEVSADLKGYTLSGVWNEEGEQVAETCYSVSDGKLLFGSELLAQLSEGYNTLYLNFAEGYADLSVLAGDPEGQYTITVPNDRINIKQGETSYDFLTGVTASKDGISEYPVFADTSETDLSVPGKQAVTYRAGATEKTVDVFVYGEIQVTDTSGGDPIEVPWYTFEESVYTQGLTVTDYFGETLTPALSQDIPDTAFGDYGRIAAGNYEIKFTAQDIVGNTKEITRTVQIDAPDINVSEVSVDLADLELDDVDATGFELTQLVAVYDSAGSALVKETDYTLSDNKFIFTANYIEELIGETGLVLHFNFENGYADPSLIILDAESPAFTVSHSLNGKYYLTEKEIPLPEADRADGSLQQISFRYTIDDEETANSSVTYAESGDHTFKLEVIRNGSAIPEATVEETFRVGAFTDLLDSNTNFADAGYTWLFSGERLGGVNTLTYERGVEDEAGKALDALRYSIGEPGQTGYNYLYIDFDFIQQAMDAGYAQLTMKLYIPYNEETASDNGYIIYTDLTGGDMAVYCGGGSTSSALADEWIEYTISLSDFSDDFVFTAMTAPEVYFSDVRFTGGEGQIRQAILSGANFAAEENNFSFFGGARFPATNTITYGEATAGTSGDTRPAMTLTISEPDWAGYNYCTFNLDIIALAIELGYTNIEFTCSCTVSRPMLFIGGSSTGIAVGINEWTTHTFALSSFNTGNANSNYFTGNFTTLSFSSITFTK